MTIKLNNYFDLDSTITCGQIFRYDIEEDNSYTVILPDRVINVKKVNDELIVESSNNDNLEEVVLEYFDLKEDYESINKEILKKDNSIKDIIEFSKGLKIINEPRFEAIISYMLSTNNSVPNIKSALDHISKRYGKKVLFRGKEYYLFPDRKDLMNASTTDLREVKCGFRDQYIYDLIHSELDVDSIENMTTKDAIDYLTSYKGIGIKVASCILLFSYKKRDVFPVDTWVKKYMKDKYNLEGINNINDYIYEKYAEYSGVVLQYIFNYNRNKEVK
ncbi:MAG: hypothetical protein IKE10_00530 [Bacilli bacterium]|nr:hypothetical protein [Bacilli bacterium]